MREFFTDRTPPDIAATYDRLAPAWLSRWSACENWLVTDQWRNDFVDRLHGDVLELGIAAGDTLVRLGRRPHDVSSYTGIDISPGMIEEAQRAAQGLALPVDLRVGIAEDMSMFADNSFDTVAASLVFCTIPDVPAALADVARVLKPEGTFVLLEHVRSPNRVVGRLQTRLAPIQVRQMGCHLDRETVRTLEGHGCRIKEERKRIMSIFRFVVATPPN